MLFSAPAAEHALIKSEKLNDTEPDMFTPGVVGILGDIATEEDVELP